MNELKDGAMSTALTGKVYLVGAGPGDPELLTVKAHKLLRRADLVLHDDLIPPAILALAGPQAVVVNAGKRCGKKGMAQEEINARMIEAARRGLEVVRLKGGDPGIFGRLAEEVEALEAAGIPFEVVPGITAGIAAAASVGASLTDRRKSSRVIIVSGHRATTGEPREKTNWRALAAEDATLVIYMPGHHLAALREELLEAGLEPAIPAVIVSHAATPRQQQWSATLQELDKLPPMESPAILLIGRSLEGAHQRLSAERLGLALVEADVIVSSL